MSGPARPMISRRALAAVLGVGALAVAGYRSGVLGRLMPQKPLPFAPMKDLAGFRVLRTGSITAGGVPLFGLDTEKPAGLVAAEKRISSDFCAALFGDTIAPGRVPMAYFFDYQCPICRRLTPRLRALQGVSIAWHDLAGLGPASETAARATIAAGFQGAYDTFHDRLMRARFQATDGYVAQLADGLGLDSDRLLRDMQSPAVGERMWLSRALANRLGMVGTPGLVIGRSVVIGDLNDGDLARIIAGETPGVCPGADETGTKP